MNRVLWTTDGTWRGSQPQPATLCNVRDLPGPRPRRRGATTTGTRRPCGLGCAGARRRRSGTRECLGACGSSSVLV